LPDEDAVKLNLNVVNFSERPAGSQAQRVSHPCLPLHLAHAPRQLSDAELETSIMRPRKFDHFKGFNFYVVENPPDAGVRRAEDEGDAEAGKNDLDTWFEVRRNVLPPDEDETRDREHPTWTVGLGVVCWVKVLTRPRVDGENGPDSGLRD
jgi:hypothetical protein